MNALGLNYFNANTLLADAGQLEGGNEVWRGQGAPLYARELDTIIVSRFIMYPKVTKPSGVITEWTIHRKQLAEVREKHNTADGETDAGFCFGCHYQDYWVHITYLLPNRAPLPYSWKVLKEEDIEQDQVPDLAYVHSSGDLIWNQGTFENNGFDTATTSFKILGGTGVSIRTDTLSYGTWWNKPDTIQVVRMVSDTAHTSFWVFHDPTPRPEIVWLIADPRGTIKYLDRRKKPFPKYFKVWPLQ